MKLLIIEDNRLLADSLKQYFSEMFIVDLVTSGKEGVRRVGDVAYDIIMLDLALPDISGLDVCTAIRDAGVIVPILVLTGRGDFKSKMALLNAGADDYMVKPFHIGELQARISALLRRRPLQPAANTLSVADLVIDTESRKVSRGGEIITLRRKEFDILEYLVRNRGRVVARTMIIDHVWEAGTDGWNNTVDVHIKHLRDKIDRPFDVKLIKTVYGIGYMIDDL